MGEKKRSSFAAKLRRERKIASCWPCALLCQEALVYFGTCNTRTRSTSSSSSSSSLHNTQTWTHTHDCHGLTLSRTDSLNPLPLLCTQNHLHTALDVSHPNRCDLSGDFSDDASKIYNCKLNSPLLGKSVRKSLEGYKNLYMHAPRNLLLLLLSVYFVLLF